jgi:hypothetical protein
MSTNEPIDVVRKFWAVWEQDNLDLVDECLGADYVNHSPGFPGQPRWKRASS